MVEEGFMYWFNNKNLASVWSAPNYCYRCGNKASILMIDSNLERTIEIFNDVPESKLSKNPRNIVPYFL